MRALRRSTVRILPIAKVLGDYGGKNCRATLRCSTRKGKPLVDSCIQRISIEIYRKVNLIFFLIHPSFPVLQVRFRRNKCPWNQGNRTSKFWKPLISTADKSRKLIDCSVSSNNIEQCYTAKEIFCRIQKLSVRSA